MTAVDIHEEVKKRYGSIAKSAAAGCGCCAPADTTAERIAEGVGYSSNDIAAVPEGSNLGLGCGNPVALAAIKPGDTVLDLGSGAGFDCFLAAQKTGTQGRVIGVDMTPAMLERARANAARGGYAHVEFREGTIESLPVEDKTADVIISNCVINLSTDKPRTFREAFRTLKPGGAIFVSDLVLKRKLPWFLRRSIALYTGCVAGALLKDDYLGAIRAAGFQDVRILNETTYGLEFLEADPAVRPLVRIVKRLPFLARYIESVASVKVTATRPA